MKECGPYLERPRLVPERATKRFAGDMQAEAQGDRCCKRRCHAKLHLMVNESKSAVASVSGRKFLGYSLWVGRRAKSNAR